MQHIHKLFVLCVCCASGCIAMAVGATETIDITIPDCDPVVQAPIITINDIPKTCHLSKTLWGNVPEGLGGYELPYTAIYNHKAYVSGSEFIDDEDYGTGTCKRGEYVFGEMKDQKDYRPFLHKYAKKNLLGFYGLSEFSLLTIYPSTYYEWKDTYETLSNKTISKLYALGYEEGYINFEDHKNDRAMFAFKGKLYSPFYNKVDQNLLYKVRNDVGIEYYNTGIKIEYTGLQQSYSSPRKITGYKNKKLIFTRQTNIVIKRDENGNAIRLGSGDAEYKRKYGKHDYGYIVSYNIETCTEN